MVFKTFHQALRPDIRKLNLQAARECLQQYGFAKTTLVDIGRRVGLNNASLYYYYRDKQAIVASRIDYASVEREAIYTIGLILKGLQS